MNSKRIIIIGTIASSLYTFRKDLILSLIDRGYTVHAFTSDSDKIELAKINYVFNILANSGINTKQLFIDYLFD